MNKVGKVQLSKCCQWMMRVLDSRGSALRSFVCLQSPCNGTLHRQGVLREEEVWAYAVASRQLCGLDLGSRYILPEPCLRDK